MVKALIIKTSALGDIVHTFPAIQFLKECEPDCGIDWIVEDRLSPLVESHPLVDEVISISTKKWRKSFSLITCQEIYQSIQKIRSKNYDVVFDFQGNTKSGILTGFAKSPLKIGFGSHAVSEKPNLWFTHAKINPIPNQNIRLDYLSLVEHWAKKKCIQPTNTLLRLSNQDEHTLHRLLKAKSQKLQFMICPGSQWENKQLQIATWIQFLQELQLKYKPEFYLISGNNKERQNCEILQASLSNTTIYHQLSFPLLQHLMKEMDRVYSVDAFPLHLAGEASVPTFSIFGPSLAKKYQPLGSQHQILQGSCPYSQTFIKRCPKLRTCPTGACIRSLKSSDLQNLK